MNMKKILLLFALLVAFATRAFAIAETVRMSVGETRKLAPSVLPTQVLAGQPAWTSSRPYDVEIVSTDMYTCTIKARRSFSGYALVHCLYYYRRLDPSGHYIGQGSGYVDYHVFVSGGSSGGAEPKKMWINPTEITLNVGTSYGIAVYVSPSGADESVTWSSSNSSVATVNSMNVLGAHRVGTAVVTATTVNGLQASCHVTVKEYTPDPVAPWDVSLPATVDLKVGESVTLTPVLRPAHATAKYTWWSSEPDIVSVSADGVVQVVSSMYPGYAIITVETDNGLDDSCTVTVMKGVSAPTNSDESRQKRAKERIDGVRFRVLNSLYYY